MLGRLTTRVAGPSAPFAAAALAAVACLALFVVDPTRLPLPACPFRAVTGLDCPGCGATRAAHHLVHGRIAVAADYNAVFVVFVPVLIAGWLIWAFPGSRSPTMRRISATSAGWTIAALGVAFAVVRNLPWEPFSLLGT